MEIGLPPNNCNPRVKERLETTFKVR